ncbi:hypothetical protein JCM11251_005376 [Rhodosporidiobolus azoricus]
MTISHKARYRPGKAPQPIKRTESMMSLPSPPSDYEYEVEHGEHGMDVDEGVREAPVLRTFVPSRGFEEEEEEVDQLDSDTEVEEDEVDRASSPVPAKRRACALGSPANLVGGGGASRRQLLNPFLQPAASTSSSSSSSSTFRPPTAYTSPTRSDFSHSSPVRKRRAADPDRLRLANAVTPPQKTRAELAEERKRQEEEEEKERRLRMMGWDDPDNPFVERDEGKMAERLKEKTQMKRPETITLVKRGQRIKTSVPFTAVLTSTSADEDPFTFTAPKLLFPPKPNRAPSPPPHHHPSTPRQQSKFLEALRAAGASEKKPAAGAGRAGAQLPPTPVTLKRKAPVAPSLPSGQGQNGVGGARFGPYKKMRGLGGGGAGGGAHVEGGLR